MNPFSESKLNVEGRSWVERIEWYRVASVLLLLFIVLLMYTWMYVWLSIPISFCIFYFQREITDKIKKNV